MEPAVSENDSRRRVLKIYTVVEKPSAAKGIWLEIGVASENRDGSISGKLDCLPVNGSIQIRDWEPKPKSEQFRRNEDRQQGQSKWQKRGESK